MSWRKKEDLGTSTVAKVHDQLRLQDQWLIDIGRGFTFWGSEHSTTVSADQPNFHNAYSIFRLHAETEIAKGHGRHEEAAAVMASQMSHSALSAIIYDSHSDSYRLQCSVYAHVDNAEWLTKVFTGAVGLQIASAREWSAWLEKNVGLEPSTSKHPTSGARSSIDTLCTVNDQFVKPYGKQDSKWIDVPDWEDAYSVIRRMAHNVKTDDRTYISADFDWLSNNPIHFEVSAVKPHMDYGNGLLLELNVPWSDEAENKGETAMRLNDMERDEWNWCHDLGSWCIHNSQLAFRCFVPNLLFCSGSLNDLVHDMAIRARWINDTAGLAVMGVTM